MIPYLKAQMEITKKNGTPVMRPLVYDFPKDERVVDMTDEYMFGEELLAAPVTEYGMRKRKVYLPKGYEWMNVESQEQFEGGQTVTVKAPLDVIPVFRKCRK